MRPRSGDRPERNAHAHSVAPDLSIEWSWPTAILSFSLVIFFYILVYWMSRRISRASSQSDSAPRSREGGEASMWIVNVIAWVAGIGLLAWMVYDALSVEMKYDREMLVSSVEGEIEKEILLDDDTDYDAAHRAKPANSNPGEA